MKVEVQDVWGRWWWLSSFQVFVWLLLNMELNLLLLHGNMQQLDRLMRSFKKGGLEQSCCSMSMIFHTQQTPLLLLCRLYNTTAPPYRLQSRPGIRRLLVFSNEDLPPRSSIFNPESSWELFKHELAAVL